MPRPKVPPRGVFVPSRLLFDGHKPIEERFPPVVRDTAIQIMALAWGKDETPEISFSELSELTGKSVPTLYAHMGLLRDWGALRWRPSGNATIIVELLDGLRPPSDSENLEMPDPIPSSSKSHKERDKNGDSEKSESKTRERDPMFDAIVEITGVDPSIKSAAASVGKARRELLQAKPPYTPEDVRKFGEWWNKDAWRRKTGLRCHQITQQIGVIRNGNRRTENNIGRDSGNGDGDRADDATSDEINRKQRERASVPKV